MDIVFTLRTPLKKDAKIRLAIILTLVLALIIISKVTPVGEWFNLDNVISAIRGSGFWGMLVFTCLFILGSFMQIPAMLFVLAAILVYGQPQGALLGYIGVVTAMTVNFLFIRMVGGNVVKEIRSKRIQKILLKLEEKPIETIVILRLVLWASPFLNYVLAMTKVRSQDFIVGSTIGITIPIVIFSGLVYFFKETVILFIN